MSPELGQRQSNGAERLSREELARRLKERGLPQFVFDDHTPLLTIEDQPQGNGQANGSDDM